LSFELLGSADLNNDGKEEIVVAFWGYIYASIEILFPDSGGYRRLEVAHWAS
jgi:hypothetical protein